MYKRNFVGVAALSSLLVLASGCGLGRTSKTTLLGTGVGAGVGAIAGGSKGTAIGAGVGAVSGFLVGVYEDKREEKMMEQGQAPPPSVVVHEHRYGPPVVYEQREPAYQHDPEYEEFLRWKAQRAAPPTP